MRLAIILSVLLHVGVLVWLFGPFTTPRPVPKFEEKPVTVGLITPSEFSQMKKGRSTGKKSDAQGGLAKKKIKKPIKSKVKLKKPPLKKAKKAVLPPPPSKKAVPAPVAKPRKVVKPKPKPRKIAKPKPAKIAKPKPKGRTKPRKVVKKKIVRKPVKKVAQKRPQPPAKRKKAKPKRFDPDNIAALLNKLPDAEPDPARVTRKTQIRPKKPTTKRTQRFFDEEAVYGRRSGQDLKVTASELDAFKARVAQCWSPPTGGMGAGRIIIRLRLSFRKNGSLANPPRLMNHSSSPVFQAVADSAIRAVWQCQPYALPVKKFKTWREMVLNFDPREMYGG